jgi:bacterial/archaeal transporter family protein
MRILNNILMGYFFALLSPFLGSIAVYLDKFLLTKYDINPILITLYSGFFAFVSGCLVLLFTGLSNSAVKSVLILVASGFFGIFYLLAYFKALTYDEGSRVAALFQFIPVIVLLLGFIFLHENLTIKQYVGSCFIIFAGLLLSVRISEINHFQINKAFWFMLLSCFFSALVYVLFKFGVKQIGFWGSLPYEGFGSGIATACILFYGNNFKLLKKSKKIFKKKVLLCMTIVELEYRISRYILFFALTLIPASVASILAGVQPFFLLIIGIILSLWFPSIIKEDVTKKIVGIKLIAFLGIFVGLYLIFL